MFYLFVIWCVVRRGVTLLTLQDTPECLEMTLPLLQSILPLPSHTHIHTNTSICVCITLLRSECYRTGCLGSLWERKPGNHITLLSTCRPIKKSSFRLITSTSSKHLQTFKCVLEEYFIEAVIYRVSGTHGVCTRYIFISI